MKRAWLLSDFFSELPCKVQSVLPNTTDEWEELICQASTQLLLPALASRSKILGISSALPRQILQLCNAAESLNAERNRTILAEALHVARLLNQVGVRPVVLKGIAYLLTDVYPDPAARYVLDIDLLIPRAEIPRAISALRENGYTETGTDRFGPFRHHHPAVSREGLPQIEIHHSLGLATCDEILPSSAIISQARPSFHDGAYFLVPTPTHLAIHLILHSQIHHPYSDRIFPPLRSFVDLAHLNSRFGEEIDWHAVDQAYRRAGELATLYLHLRHARGVIGLSIPSMQMVSLPFLLNVRWARRLMLNRYPALRFIDPFYLLMSLFSRRVPLIVQILRNRKSWGQILRTLTSESTSVT